MNTQPLVSAAEVTVEDLKSDAVGENYWKILAERRLVTIDEKSNEIQELIEIITSLQIELDQSKSELAETENLVDVLIDILVEMENNKADTATTSEAKGIESAKTKEDAV